MMLRLSTRLNRSFSDELDRKADAVVIFAVCSQIRDDHGLGMPSIQFNYLDICNVPNFLND